MKLDRATKGYPRRRETSRELHSAPGHSGRLADRTEKCPLSGTRPERIVDQNKTASARVRNRRILPVGGCPTKGPLAETTADALPSRRGLLFLPHCGQPSVQQTRTDASHIRPFSARKVPSLRPVGARPSRGCTGWDRS